MATDSEPFDELRKLLALKRHEVPPPGYFDRLPREIHVRLAARQPAARAMAAPDVKPSWLATFLRLVGSRPSFVGALGAAVSGVILAGIIYGHYRETPASPLAPELVQMPSILPGITEAPAAMAVAPVLTSTNPILPRPPASLLFDGSWLQAQPATTPPLSR